MAHKFDPSRFYIIARPKDSTATGVVYGSQTVRRGEPLCTGAGKPRSFGTQQRAYRWLNYEAYDWRNRWTVVSGCILTGTKRWRCPYTALAGYCEVEAEGFEDALRLITAKTSCDLAQLQAQVDGRWQFFMPRQAVA